MNTTYDPFYFYDIPAQMREKWWSLSPDNRLRVYAYYRKLWFMMQEIGHE